MINKRLKKNLIRIKKQPLNEYGMNITGSKFEKVYIQNCNHVGASKVNSQLAAEYYSILGWKY
jgi:hypothetical protein